MTSADTPRPKCSIVLTCYLGLRWIERTIESVLSLAYQNWELVIVNDASPDDSASLLERYRQRDSRIIVLTNPVNLGIARTCNRGVRESTGTYVSFLDQDDLLMPNKLDLQVRYLEAHPAAGVVWGRVELIDAEGHPLGERKLNDPKEGSLFLPFFEKGAAPLISCLFRRSLLDRVGLFDETLEGNEDFDFMLRVAHATSFGFVPEFVVKQRVYEGSFSQTDRMVLDQFRLSDVLAAAWPQHSGLVRRHRSRAHLVTAHYLVRTQRIEQAREHFLRSALLQPGALKTWVLWLVALLPSGLRDKLPGRLRLSPEKYLK